MKRLVYFVLLGMATWVWGLDLQVAPSSPPGTYPQSLTIHLTATPGAILNYRFVEGLGSTFQPWPGELVLSALPGEVRSYQLRVQMISESGESLTKDFRYTLQGRSAQVPKILPVPGYYTKAVTPQIELPTGWSLLWNGQPFPVGTLLDAPSGETRQFSFDVIGPEELGQPQLHWVYQIDRRGQSAVGLEILSPIAGHWANPQWLVLNLEGLDQVLWNWGDTFDSEKAQIYRGPVALNRSGELSLTVAGRSRKDGSWIQKAIHWSNSDSQLTEINLPESVVIQEALTLAPAEDSLISWDDGQHWQKLDQERIESILPQSLKILKVQRQRLSDHALFRMVYWLDSRVAATPKVKFWGGWNPVAVFEGSTAALHEVLWTDSSEVVTTGQALWGPAGVWKIPDGASSVQIKATLPNGSSSITSVMAPPRAGWSIPDWAALEPQGLAHSSERLPLGGRVIPRLGLTPVYQIGASEFVAEPRSDSPGLWGPLLPQVPVGCDRVFFLRLAWSDDAGVIGPASAPLEVRVDRRNPLPPEIHVGEDSVLISDAEADSEPPILLYAVTDHRVDSTDQLEFKVYSSPIRIKDFQDQTGLKPVWIHALAQDRSGNLSLVQKNIPVIRGGQSALWKGLSILDPEQSTGEQILKDNAVIVKSRLRLQPLWSGDPQGVFYGESPAAELPQNWPSLLQPYDHPLTWAISPGTRQTFHTLWNIKTDQGWLWEKPISVAFTLDQGPPAEAIVDAFPATELTEAWTLNAQAGQIGDRLVYSLSTDESLPPDPFSEAGLPWPGQMLWNCADEQRLRLRLRLGVISAAGVRQELGPFPIVTIDKRVPDEVKLMLDPFTYVTAPLRITMNRTTFLVRMAMTEDGSLPEIPNATARAISTPELEFPGKAGQVVVYRFRLRSFTASGRASSAGNVYTVLVDRTAPPAGQTRPSEQRLLTQTFQITGIPENGLSHEPMVIQASHSWGILRYELAEDGAPPRPVDEFSPQWTETLSLTGEANQDHAYALSIRSYDEAGTPLTPEARWSLRVDRLAPAKPAIQVNRHAQRTEAELHFETPQLQADEQLLYRWSWQSYPDGSGTEDWTVAAKPSVLFNAPNDAFTEVTVQAVVRDPAGNVSPQAEVNFILDQNVLYLSPKAGESGDGSREHPLQTFEAALEKMRASGRKILFLASGSYGVSRPADITNLQLYGGLSDGQWEKSSGESRSTLVTSPQFVGDYLLASYAGTSRLERLDWQANSTRLKTVVLVENSQMLVANSSWQSRQTSRLWTQNQGRLNARNITAQLSGATQARIFDLTDTDLQLNSINLSAQQNQEARLIALKNCQGTLLNLVILSRKASGLDGALYAVDSHFTISGFRVLAGESADWASAMILQNSSVTVFDPDISLFATRGNTGFQLTQSELEVQKGAIVIQNGLEFNQGAILQNSKLIWNEGNLRLDGGAYQGGFSQTAGSLTLRASRIQIQGGGNKAWGLQTMGECQVHLMDNTWILLTQTSGKALLVEQPWVTGSEQSQDTTIGW